MNVIHFLSYTVHNMVNGVYCQLNLPAGRQKWQASGTTLKFMTMIPGENLRSRARRGGLFQLRRSR